MPDSGTLDTDSVEFLIDPVNGSRTPNPVVHPSNLSPVGIPRAGESALHCEPNGMWVEPHPRQPQGEQLVFDSAAGTNAFQRYGDTVNLFNWDAYDKVAMFVLCGIIHDVPTGDVGNGTHVMRFGYGDNMKEVARQSMPFCLGSNRVVPSIISTVEFVPVPAGSGMLNRRVVDTTEDSAGLVVSNNQNPGAPPVITVRLQHFWRPLNTQAIAPLGINRLRWSYVVA